MQKQGMKMKYKLVLVLSIFVIISTGAVAYCLINIKAQKSDALIINIAGRQRALSQAMSKSALGLFKTLHANDEKSAGAVEAYKKDIADKQKVFNNTLTAFTEGGQIKDGESVLSIPRTTDPAIRTKLDESKAMWDKFSGRLDEVLSLTGDHENPKFLSALQYVEDNNMPLFKDMNALTMMFQAASDAKLGYFKKVLYAGIILNLLTFAVVIWIINRLIITRLHGLHEHMKGITTGDGDLTRRLDTSNLDEIGVLGQEFNELLAGFEVIIGKLSASCAHLRDSSERLNATFSTMVDGLNRQDQKTRQIATATEEMSATVIEVAKNASSMAETAHSADEAARSGDECVRKVIGRMNDIALSTKESVKVVAELGAESQKIGNIVSVINEIADQTNLLALNAAIEAARAGDQGRGFAVVADEVRKLAERTTKATKEIGVMISGIQSESKKAIESIEMEFKNVDEGVKLTREAGAALNEITSSIGHVNDSIRFIATSTEQQSAVASTISSDMDAVAQISMDSARGVKGVSQLSEELRELAHELENTLSRFKVGGKDEAGEQKKPIERKEAAIAATARLAVGNA